MYRAPFHRRILPWIFAIVFIAAAPALIFYTAGYRWNPKKDKVERNGTLIIDSKPSGAAIFLNGENTNETTPVTLQDTAPGKYLIHVEKNGYLPWDKELDVQPEYVTFANSIWLWKSSQPQKTTIESSQLRMEPSPNESAIAMATDEQNQGTITIWDPTTNQNQSFRLDGQLSSNARLLWSSDSRALAIEDESSSSSRAWLVNLRNGSTMHLPDGNYQWNGSELDGHTENDFIRILANDGSITRSTLPPGVIDHALGFMIRSATGTENSILFRDANPHRGDILPLGNWHVADINGSTLILRDQDHWLSLDPSTADSNPHRVVGDQLRAFVQKQKSTYVLMNGGEIWLWNPSTEPELLLRQSQPLVQAVWHNSGENILLATQTDVSMLNLDPRDGRLNTPLAHFDHINDITILKKVVYISGTLNGQSGIWSLEIE